MADLPRVRAAGGVLWRRVDGELRIALVHRPKYDDWSLPKGKLDPGEPAVVGGVREVWEETGFRGVPGRTLGESRYRVLSDGREAEKTVRWWAMRTTEGEFVPGAEVDQLRWVSLQSALARVSAGYDCAPLQAFAAAPPETTQVLLVRHASAGDRDSWAGPDDERPLDPTGKEQADALAALLAAYAPRRVLSAPLRRCLDTVRPLADQLGIPLTPAREAREDENDWGAGPLVRLLTELGGAGQHAVVCSQGGAIPAAVEALTGESDVPARKGSVWVLSFAEGRLVDAAYTRDPLH